MNRRTPTTWTEQPQEVPDAEYEQLVARVCAIDVGKQAGKVCTRIPHAEQAHRRVCTETRDQGRGAGLGHGAP